jgi:hypothetical protein
MSAPCPATPLVCLTGGPDLSRRSLPDLAVTPLLGEALLRGTTPLFPLTVGLLVLQMVRDLYRSVGFTDFQVALEPDPPCPCSVFLWMEFLASSTLISGFGFSSSAAATAPALLRSTWKKPSLSLRKSETGPDTAASFSLHSSAVSLG